MALGFLTVTLVLASVPIGEATTEDDRRTVDVPSVEGPITGGLKGHPFGSPPFDLAEHGFVEEEFFVTGTAAAHGASPSVFLDDPGGSAVRLPDAPYTTRIVVRRPIDPDRFNGTVLVEWLNVTSGYDVDVDWVHTYEEILRRGYAYVGLTAQPVGVTGLKAYDPLRYAPLAHPGDTYSYDILSQAAKVLRATPETDPMGGLLVERIIASGSSQSARALGTYVNEVHQTVERVIDAFFIVVGGGTLRADLDVPVLRLLSENEATDDGQPDSDFYRQWEVAGASHTDARHGEYWSKTHDRDWGTPPGTWPLTPRDNPGVMGIGQCKIGAFPRHYAAKAALHHIDRWVRDRTPPPTARRLTLDDGEIVRDELGNAVGGIRLPAIEVPTATYLGDSSDCGPTLGRTIPFDDDTLRDLYPSHQAYVSAVNRATAKALGAGFLLPEDAKRVRKRAATSHIGR